MLTLVSATYQSAVSVTLTFNQPIDISGLAGAQFTVVDGPAAKVYFGTGGSTLVSPGVVRINLLQIAPSGGPNVQLTASGTNGIVAVNGGQEWTGTGGIVLPFP